MKEAEKWMVIRGENKAVVCALLLILYKLDITQGGELNLGELNRMRLSYMTATETIIL